MNNDQTDQTPDEEWALHAKMLELEVADDGKQPVPLGEALAQTLQEMHERGVITPSQIVDTDIAKDAADELADDLTRETALDDAAHPAADNPMEALRAFLDGRTVGVWETDIANVNLADRDAPDATEPVFHWRGMGYDEGWQRLNPGELQVFGRLMVDALRVGR